MNLETIIKTYPQYVVGIIMAALTILIAVLNQRRKQITYDIYFDYELASVKRGHMDDVEILYKKKKVNDVVLTLIMLQNSGNVPIEQRDYERPISIEFGEEVQILHFEVIQKRPNSLKVKTKNKNGSIVIEPLLLNPSDALLFKILSSGRIKDEVKITGRISGIKNIYEKKLQTRNSYNNFKIKFLRDSQKMKEQN